MRDIRRIINSLTHLTTTEQLEIPYTLTDRQVRFLDILVNEGMISHYTWLEGKKRVSIIKRTGFPISGLRYKNELVSAKQLTQFNNTWGIISTQTGLLLLMNCFF